VFPGDAGLPVEGPIAAILLLLTGRMAALPELSGAGTAELRKPEAAAERETRSVRD
jgi:hypothetical protein